MKAYRLSHKLVHRLVFTNITLLMCLLMMSTLAFSSASTYDKVALVIGNARYIHAEYLPNPVNDANEVAVQLRELGFHVIQGTNLTDASMKSILRTMTQTIAKESVVLFYYAGHGMQKDGRNYLIPINANITKSYEIEYTSLDLNMVLKALNEVKPKLTIALVDACRDNPFEKRIHGKNRSIVSRGNGLAVMGSMNGTILSYATEPGSTAVDGYEAHSPYTSALLKHMARPGLTVHEMLNEVGLEVVKNTDGDQKPWLASSPVLRYCLAGCGTGLKEEDLAKVARLKRAFERRDLIKLIDIVEMTQPQQEKLKQLFSVYQGLTVSTLMSTSTNYRRHVTINIIEATNTQGNRVIPSDKWSYISFLFKEK